MSHRYSYFMILATFLMASASAFEVLSDHHVVSAFEGEDVDLSCSSSDPYEYCDWKLGGKVCKFEWKRSYDKVIKQECIKELDNRLDFVGDYKQNQCSLRVSNVQMSDRGSWKCEIEEYSFWNVGSRKEASVFLDVQRKPIMTSTTSTTGTTDTTTTTTTSSPTTTTTSSTTTTTTSSPTTTTTSSPTTNATTFTTTATATLTTTSTDKTANATITKTANTSNSETTATSTTIVTSTASNISTVVSTAILSGSTSRSLGTTTSFKELSYDLDYDSTLDMDLSATTSKETETATEVPTTSMHLDMMKDNETITTTEYSHDSINSIQTVTSTHISTDQAGTISTNLDGVISTATMVETSKIPDTAATNNPSTTVLSNSKSDNSYDNIEAGNDLEKANFQFENDENTETSSPTNVIDKIHDMDHEIWMVLGGITLSIIVIAVILTVACTRKLASKNGSYSFRQLSESEVGSRGGASSGQVELGLLDDADLDEDIEHNTRPIVRLKKQVSTFEQDP